ncbi:MAG TPA: PQQ-binding-like beta-propeller repeat protein [Thermoanaerobaculia bacterium]|nr:PQQ-binding-like beta-propeller repeat protein [Thermoanaerobaculia bacterium]
MHPDGKTPWTRMTPALFFLLGLLPLQAQNWPAFRGPGGGGVAEGPGPTAWDVERSTNVKWKTEIPGLGHSSPVVWGDRVFVTTAVSSGTGEEIPKALGGEVASSSDMAPHSWRVYCLDKRTGKILWEKVLHEGVPRIKRHVRNSFATPTPATDGRHLVVSFGAEGLFGLDLDGKVLWRQDLGTLAAGYYADTKYQWGFGSSPILYGDLVIIQADVDREPFLAAYDLATGKPVWKTAREDRQSWSTPGVTRGLEQDELVTIAPQAVRGYDPKTGRELWRLDWKMDITQSTPVVSDGVIYLSSGKGPQQPILALRPGARGDITPQPGKPLDPHIVWLKDRGGPITTSPLVYGGYLYSLVDQGILRCLSLATGEEVYTERVRGEFLSSPVAAGGKLYLTAVDGDVHVVRAGPRYEQLAVSSLDEISYATPAISDGLLIVRTRRFLYGIAEPATPEQRKE